VQQADLCLLVAKSSEGSDLSEAEREAVYRLVPQPQQNADGTAQMAPVSRTFSRKELVLLHDSRDKLPSGTRAWLRKRRVAWHHHVRGGEGAPGLLDREFDRIARHLCGRSRGLVLGGGGSRGLAHLGVLEVLERRGIDIDVIGGTSQGAFMAAAYATTLNVDDAKVKAKKLADKIGSLYNLMFELTLPVLSYFSGVQFNDVIQATLGPAQIEDLPIKYYCVSTNVTDSCMSVHTAGPLWRYVRASMTVMGLLPPLYDRGRLLVDGGYVNNLPADVMRSLAPQVNTIIGVDVENKDNAMFEGISDPGDSISGWYLAWRWVLSVLRIGEPLRIPSLSEISLRVAFISHSMMLRDLLARADDSIIYIRPDVGLRFKLLDYDKMQQIVDYGAEAAELVLSKWERRQKRKWLKEARRTQQLSLRAAADAGAGM
jgi:lysophospholipid hydrolase